MINKFFRRGMWHVKHDCPNCGNGKKRFATEIEADAFIAECSGTPVFSSPEPEVTSWLEDFDYEEEEDKD
jgi:hypothetical protein